MEKSYANEHSLIPSTTIRELLKPLKKVLSRLNNTFHSQFGCLLCYIYQTQINKIVSILMLLQCLTLYSYALLYLVSIN